MKSLLCTLAIAATIAAPSFATADVITGAVVSNGTITTSLPTGALYAPASGDTSAVLQSFTVGSVNYDTLIGADGWVGDVEGVLYQLGGTAVTDPSIALGDLDLATGTLDPYGTTTFVGNQYFDFASQTITNDTVFFLFNNGTQTGEVALVNSTGADITNARNHLLDLGGEVLLNNFAFSRTNGGDLASRDVAGNIFAVSEFTFGAGFSAADVVGFRGSGGAFDAQDAGIAFAAAIPEPSSAILLMSGLGTFLVRRRK